MQYMRKYKLDNLFDKIIWLQEEDSKADFITDLSSIFIDDSYAQRLEVEKVHGIPSFEPNMIEVLIDGKNE
jgi:carbamoyl-phosphate synthase large subunit